MVIFEYHQFDTVISFYMMTSLSDFNMAINKTYECVCWRDLAFINIARPLCV